MGKAISAVRRTGPPVMRMGLLMACAWASPLCGAAAETAGGPPEQGQGGGGSAIPAVEAVAQAPDPAAPQAAPPSVETNAPAGSEKIALGEKRKSPHVSMRLRTQYDYRSQGSERDTDVYGYFYGGVRDLNDGRLDFYMSGRMHSDLDETETQSLADDPFLSLDDSNGVTEQRLQQLYADLHDRTGRITLRAGRQYVESADYLHIDGAQVGFREQDRLGGRVYLGQPVSYYSSVSGDLAGGLSLVGRPWENNRTRLTFARYTDDSEDESDQDYFLDVQQNLSEETRTRGQFSLLNDSFRMGRLDVFHFAEDGKTDFALGGSYWGRFDARTQAYSPLYRVLGEQQPYSYGYARLTQEIAPSFLVSPGVSLRFAGDGDNDFNNRDYQNYDLSFTYEPVRSLSTSISLQYWSVEDEDSFLGVGWEVRYRHRRVWEISGGAAFAQYTYDTVSDIDYSVNGGQTVFSENGTIIEESPDFYTYFLRAKWNITRKLALRLQFDIEDDRSSSEMAYWARGSMEVRY